MKISVICPVYNEFPWIGYSLMAVINHIHEVIYACADSNDGTDELLGYIHDKYYGERLKILRKPEYNFKPHDQKAYNQSFNDCIARATGEAVWFLHPDMLVTNPEAITALQSPATAFITNVTSYAGDFRTKISQGRATQWKNIHRKTLSLHYFGGYGSMNEDFYHRDITGNSYKHFGTDFKKYPFRVVNSGINVNHYCELKAYKRRLEKMKLCLKTQNPTFTDAYIEELAQIHPRVTLEKTTTKFGAFEFTPSQEPIPDVIQRYKDEFAPFAKVAVPA